MLINGMTKVGKLVEVLVTEAGAVVTNGGAGGEHTSVNSGALGKSHIFADAACRLRAVRATNAGVADAWLQVFDAVALPNAGTMPDRCPVLVPAGLSNGDEYTDGTPLTNGCVVALSTTRDTLTLIGGDVARFFAEVEL